METSIVKFAGKEISVVRTKGGFSIPSQKRLGEITGLKGKELKRKFFDFRLEVGKIWNGELCAMKGRDEILAQRIVPCKDGFTVKYVETKNLNVPDVKNSTKIAKEAILNAAEKLFKGGKFATLDEAIAFLA